MTPLIILRIVLKKNGKALVTDAILKIVSFQGPFKDLHTSRNLKNKHSRERGGGRW